MNSDIISNPHFENAIVKAIELGYPSLTSSKKLSLITLETKWIMRFYQTRKKMKRTITHWHMAPLLSKLDGIRGSFNYINWLKENPNHE